MSDICRDDFESDSAEQVSIIKSEITIALAGAKLSGAALSVALIMLDHIRSDHSRSDGSLFTCIAEHQLAALTGLSRSGVRKGRKELRERGAIVPWAVSGGRSCFAWYYFDPAWARTQLTKSRAYCRFSQPNKRPA